MAKKQLKLEHERCYKAQRAHGTEQVQSKRILCAGKLKVGRVCGVIEEKLNFALRYFGEQYLSRNLIEKDMIQVIIWFYTISPLALAYCNECSFMLKSMHKMSHMLSKRKTAIADKF